ncbi:hypothetical protein MHY85_10215 [Cellulomonas sp. ACRRI]|uniref:hypothetical protein n=1 Tax=Cellulomonas sp. ACRRI TaxID=2918188 RepID=UPI001EF22F7A|nr:hypothetical protein [Cellulomonas sp. ACRRI]MCG7286343.1 hypothetical protein [Cellulomonas sp. ACRRI]
MDAATARRQGDGGGDAPSTPEYDAFGPWVDPVRTAEEVPPLYRDHPVDLAGSRLVLKVPRDIARRDATPEMDLYDHLLVLGPDRFTALSRRTGGDAAARGRGASRGAATGRGYDVREVPYDQVAAVGTSVDLLDGRLTVRALAGPSVAVRFSGSSADVVEGFVDTLRTLAWPVPTTGDPAPRDPTAGGPGLGRLDRRALGEKEIGLVSAYREVADREPGLRALAAHPRRTVVPRRGGLTRVLHVLHPMTVQAAVVASDGRELQLFGRRAWLARGRTPVNSESRLVLPLDRLTEVRAAEHPGYADLVVVTLRAGDAAIDLPVPAGSDAERVLTGLLR